MYVFDLIKEEVIATSEVLAIEESFDIVMDLFFTAEEEEKDVSFYNIRYRCEND